MLNRYKIVFNLDFGPEPLDAVSLTGDDKGLGPLSAAPCNFTGYDKRGFQRCSHDNWLACVVRCSEDSSPSILLETIAPFIVTVWGTLNHVTC